MKNRERGCVNEIMNVVDTIAIRYPRQKKNEGLGD